MKDWIKIIKMSEKDNKEVDNFRGMSFQETFNKKQFVADVWVKSEAI